MSDSALGGSLMKMENWKCNIPADLSYANAEAPLFTAASSRRILPRDLLNPRATLVPRPTDSLLPVNPLADGRGSDRSHDREGVASRKSTLSHGRRPGRAV